MSTQFLAKLLLYYHRKNDNSGSVILPMSIFVILILIFFMVILPQVTGNAKNAPLHEAQINIDNLNELQQKYFSQHHKFSNTLVKLPNSEYYKYSTIATEKAVYSYALPKQKYSKGNLLTPTEFPYYIGAVFLIPPEGKSKEYKFTTIICEPRKYTYQTPQKPTLKSDGFPACGRNTKQVMLLIER